MVVKQITCLKYVILSINLFFFTYTANVCYQVLAYDSAAAAGATMITQIFTVMSK